MQLVTFLYILRIKIFGDFNTKIYDLIVMVSDIGRP